MLNKYLINSKNCCIFATSNKDDIIELALSKIIEKNVKKM